MGGRRVYLPSPAFWSLQGSGIRALREAWGWKGTRGKSRGQVREGRSEATTVYKTLVLYRYNTTHNPSPPLSLNHSSPAIALAVTFFAFCFGGTSLGFSVHSPFLFGLGDLGSTLVSSLPPGMHPEPSNALSIPTWAIHFSSVFEWLFAMATIWRFAEVTGNEKWKGMTWGMLPLHASGVAACTYHFFYNDSSLQFLVSTQAGLTLLGNLTCAIAAYRIAVSNGWTVVELNPFKKGEEGEEGGIGGRGEVLAVDGGGAALTPYKKDDSEVFLVGKLLLGTLATAYAVKYGELYFELPFTANGVVGTGLVLGAPALVAGYYYNKGNEGEGGEKKTLEVREGGGGEGGWRGGEACEEDTRWRLTLRLVASLSSPSVCGR